MKIGRVLEPTKCLFVEGFTHQNLSFVTKNKIKRGGEHIDSIVDNAKIPSFA